MLKHCLKLAILMSFFFISQWTQAGGIYKEHLEARWNPIHFKPAIDQATNEQCLACHAEIIENKPLKTSPAGIKASDSLAWYQTLTDYQGEQDTFHRRHLSSDAAKKLMNFKCNTCHQGNNPDKEVSATESQPHADANIRKTVDTNICLMCHGKFANRIMNGVQGDWPEIRKLFNNDCYTCHLGTRTVRHRLNFLNGAAIEKAGKENGDSCYGCHGGRAWYAISYPYVRTPWLERMPSILPDWAEGRPTEYPARFLSDKDNDEQAGVLNFDKTGKLIMPEKPESPAQPAVPKPPENRITNSAEDSDDGL